MNFDFKNLSFTVLTNEIIPALLILVVGYFLIKIILKVENTALEKSKLIDPMLFKFIRNSTRIILWILLILEVLKKLGVDATSLITVFAACGAAIALALQGSLSNLAGGILIMMTRPFIHGDYIKCNGVEGTVDSIDLLYTNIITGDGKVINVPNSNLTNNTITNYSKLGVRRVEVKIGVSYNCNLDDAKYTIVAKAKHDNRFLIDRPMTCDVCEYADSSVVLLFRAWVKSEDYWPVYYEVNNHLKHILDEAGIEIPYPQLDIHNK